MRGDSYRTIEMHTAGEPVRIIVEGHPPLVGATILEKRRQAQTEFDYIRRRLMLEPRGHPEMYGVIPTTPSHPEADLAVLFTHNSGYSTMCGHATIAIGRWAIEHGVVRPRGDGPVAEFSLECPCGPVSVFAHRDPADRSRIRRVEFDSVPAFAAELSCRVETKSFGSVIADLSYGGAFYLILPASRLGLSIFDSPYRDLVAAAVELTDCGRQQLAVRHPSEPDLGFLYGTILTCDATPADPATHNLCIFGEGQVDRSPTGSGVTARVALDHAKGLLKPDDSRQFRGLSGDPFTGAMVGEARCGDRPAVIVRVGGQAFYSGTATFTVEPDDPLAEGLALPQRMREIWGGPR
jgi:trans-L-3-hydroxyproline dehydratase